MRWSGGRESENIEDRRGFGLSPGLAGGGIGTVVIVLLGLFFGVDPSVLLDSLQGDQPVAQHRTAPPADDPARRFVSVVLAETEDTWGELFRRAGLRYEAPKLVLFSGAVQSACGLAHAATGPFYCPPDRKVYLDLSFFRELRDRLGAPGEFAEAYVIAHEVGHHVQNLLGISSRIQAMREHADRAEANRLSVRLELQADCFAGVWAHHTDRAQHILEKGDVEQGLNAAAAVGDDRLQRQARGVVVPESFTHGSSTQRVRWFKTGLQSGSLRACDTLAADRL
jgi:uncharacterized protein